MKLVYEDTPLFWRTLKAALEDQVVWSAPSDTVYGLAARAPSAESVAALDALKPGRTNPYLILVESLDQAKALVPSAQQHQETLRRYWPGPFTFILPTEGNSSVALRCPDSRFLLGLISAAGGPLYSTSCNPPGLPPALNSQRAEEFFGDRLGLYIDGGPSQIEQPSALVDLTGPTISVLRTGPKPFDGQ